MFNNELTWLFLSMAIVISTIAYTISKVDIEKEKTAQLELQLKIAQIVSTNNVEK